MLYPKKIIKPSYLDSNSVLTAKTLRSLKKEKFKSKINYNNTIYNLNALYITLLYYKQKTKSAKYTLLTSRSDKWKWSKFINFKKCLYRYRKLKILALHSLLLNQFNGLKKYKKNIKSVNYLYKLDLKKGLAIKIKKLPLSIFFKLNKVTTFNDLIIRYNNSLKSNVTQTKYWQYKSRYKKQFKVYHFGEFYSDLFKKKKEKLKVFYQTGFLWNSTETYNKPTVQGSLFNYNSVQQSKIKNINYSVSDFKYRLLKTKVKNAAKVFILKKKVRRYKFFFPQRSLLYKLFYKKFLINADNNNKLPAQLKTLFKKNFNIVKKLFVVKYSKTRYKRKKSYKKLIRQKVLIKRNRWKAVKIKPFKTQFLYVSYKSLLYKPSYVKKKIYNYFFLTKYSLKSFLIDFYSQLKSFRKTKVKFKKRKKTLLLNFRKKKLTTFKRARQLHWDLYTKKTLKTRRYKNFLPPFLKPRKLKKEFIITYFSIKFNFSAVFWKAFTSMCQELLNKSFNIKEIYQFPINYVFWTFLKINKKIKIKIKIKIKHWVRKKARIKKKFWMQSKRNIPKFFFKQPMYNRNILNNVQYDYLTNYFCIFKNFKNLYQLNSLIYDNKLLKLHNFRYKA